MAWRAGLRMGDFLIEVMAWHNADTPLWTSLYKILALLENELWIFSKIMSECGC